MATKLSPKLKEQFALFLEQHPPRQFSIVLRRMLLEYIQLRLKIGFDIEFDRLLQALSDWLDLLDEAARENVNTKPGA